VLGRWQDDRTWHRRLGLVVTASLKINATRNNEHTVTDRNLVDMNITGGHVSGCIDHRIYSTSNNQV
jgi:hypothetical protein